MRFSRLFMGVLFGNLVTGSQAIQCYDCLAGLDTVCGTGGMLATAKTCGEDELCRHGESQTINSTTGDLLSEYASRGCAKKDKKLIGCTMGPHTEREVLTHSFKYYNASFIKYWCYYCEQNLCNKEPGLFGRSTAVTILTSHSNLKILVFGLIILFIQTIIFYVI